MIETQANRRDKEWQRRSGALRRAHRRCVKEPSRDASERSGQGVMNSHCARAPQRASPLRLKSGRDASEQSRQREWRRSARAQGIAVASSAITNPRASDSASRTAHGIEARTSACESRESSSGSARTAHARAAWAAPLRRCGSRNPCEREQGAAQGFLLMAGEAIRGYA